MSSSGLATMHSDEEDSEDQGTSGDRGPKGAEGEGQTFPSDQSGASTVAYKERRRSAHTQAEQKRRDSIKRGYDFLQDLVPAAPGDAEPTCLKVSKAAVLQRSIDCIHQMESAKKAQEGELTELKKEVVALQIMRTNYEKLVQSHKAQPSSDQETVVPAEIKFETFKLLVDSLFIPFGESVPMDNFGALSAGVFSWLEEECKPQMLQELMYNILQQVRNQYDAVGNGGGGDGGGGQQASGQSGDLQVQHEQQRNQR